jgi:TatD DNase family protein
MEPIILESFVDCHSHIDQFDQYEISDILQRAKTNNVNYIVSAGVTLDSSAECIRLSQIYPEIIAGVGIHPMDLNGGLSDKNHMSLMRLLENKEVKCMSEIGLDYPTNSTSIEKQFEAFRIQINLAKDFQIPIVFHCREMPNQNEQIIECLKVLKQEKAWKVGGAWHYFQGDINLAKECIDMGFRISIGKPLLRLSELQLTIKNINLKDILLETDSFPQPFKKRRDKWTEPKDVFEIARKISEIQSIDIKTVAKITTSNFFDMIN